MPRTKLTPDACRRAKPGEHYDTHWRLPGSLSLRVSKTGVRSWCYLDARRKRHHLGRWPLVSLDDAIHSAERIARRMGHGSPTVEDLALDQLDRLATSGAPEGTLQTRRAILDRYVLPDLGDTRVCEITPAPLQALIDAREAARQWATAASILGTLRWLFAGVVTREQHEYDPSRSLSVTRRDRRRRTLCTLDTLVKVWRSCDAYANSGPRWRQLQALAIQFHVASVQRSRQILELHRPHLSGWWDHPGEFTVGERRCRTKNGQPQSIYLTPLLRAILDKAEPGHWPFAVRTPFRRFRGDFLAELRKRAGITSKEWVPHDDRKVCSTTLDRAGVPIDHIQRLLSHTRQRSTATHFYVVPEPRDPIVRETQEAWEEHLLKALRGDAMQQQPLPEPGRSQGL